MSGKHHGRVRMIGRGRIYVEAIALDRHFPGLIAKTAEFSIKIVAYGSFIAADGLDVHELARERNSVHGEKNSRR